MLQTSRIKEKFSKDTFIAQSMISRKSKFEVGNNSYLLPKKVEYNGNLFEFEKKIFECQVWKYIYRNIEFGQITFW